MDERKENMKFEEPNEITYMAMETAEKDENIFGPFNSTKEMMKELNTEEN